MYKFFAYLNRMKFINRWSLMRSTINENIMEHSHQTAVVAHALASIENTYFGGNLDANSVAVKALFHESSEVITGDLPTPIKYFNPQINSAYKHLEQLAKDKLLAHLPSPLTACYSQILNDESSVEYKFVKYADKICAYLKCIEELRLGNREFEKARETLKNSIENLDSSAVNFFMENFVTAYELTLDELE